MKMGRGPRNWQQKEQQRWSVDLATDARWDKKDGPWTLELSRKKCKKIAIAKYDQLQMQIELTLQLIPANLEK